MKSKTLVYYIVIGLSVFDLISILGLGAHLIVSLINNKPIGAAFNTVQSNSTISMIQVVEIIIITFCIIVYPFLTKWRQKLRDEVEYDENGVSKKHGKFSQLTTKERKEIDLQNTMDAERILSANTIKTIKKDVFKDPDAELNKLIGLANVKLEIQKMEARMQYELKREQERTKKKAKHIHMASSAHMVFLGNPGTGKTTVSRIIASYLYKYHFMEKPYYFEIDGNFFNGLTIGEASKKVLLLCREAKGSCVYIDEAYALCSSRSQEVIATLVKQMEDNADNITFIYSGYKKEMTEFLDSNSGIKSRIKYWFTFEDYNDNELREIFCSMAASNNLVPEYELIEHVVEIVSKKRGPNFGNARDVRNLLDQIIDNHAFNLAQGIDAEGERYKLVARDLRNER